MAHHGDDAPDTIHNTQSVEDLSYDELQFLLQYVTGERPIWGNSTDWFECDEVIFFQILSRFDLCHCHCSL